MKRKLILPKDFRGVVGDHTTSAGDILDAEQNPIAIARDAIASLDPSVDLDAIQNRSIPYIFSTEQVARDGHTVRTAGFDLVGFSPNPVFLWAHQSDEPPIGKVTDLTLANGIMRGVVEYMDADLSPFADMIFRMVKKRFLNATSISWRPLEWKFSTDRARPGGIDFIRQDLLEISQVPVPALTAALATARSAGIDTTPMTRWAEKVLDGGALVLVPRAELESLRTASKMPKAKRAAAAVEINAPKVTRKFSRDLFCVGELATTLLNLDWIQEWSEWEAEYEGDGSQIPARLKDVVNQLGSILVDMTLEEVAELLEIEGQEEGTLDGTVISAAAKTDAQRALLMLASMVRSANAHNQRRFVLQADRPLAASQVNAMRSQVQDWLRAGQAATLVLDQGLTIREMTAPTAADDIALPAYIESRVRAGRVLNATNEAALRQALDLISGVVNQVEAQPAEEPPIVSEADSSAEARAARQRIAEFLALADSDAA